MTEDCCCYPAAVTVKDMVTGFAQPEVKGMPCPIAPPLERLGVPCISSLISNPGQKSVKPILTVR